MANLWFVLVPTQAEQNVAGTVADAFIVEVAQGSAVANELTNNYAGKVTVGGKSGYLRAGPFTTLAAAQAYLQVGAQTTSTPIPGLGITPGGQITATNPLNFLQPIGQFFSDLGKANTWIRVAKVVVGGLLLIIGLVHITGVGGAVADTARKVPVPI
jgi:hypothetical protein